jgi:hypothetical protein
MQLVNHATLQALSLAFFLGNSGKEHFAAMLGVRLIRPVPFAPQELFLLEEREALHLVTAVSSMIDKPLGSSAIKSFIPLGLPGS